MDDFSEFLSSLLHTGKVTLRRSPVPPRLDRASALVLLQHAHADFLLDLPGPPLPFVPETALDASIFTARACWFLVCRESPAQVVEQLLALPTPPQSPAEHFSADIVFRYLPAVQRRARAIDPADVLSRRLEELFGAWPLSGVLGEAGQHTPAEMNLGEHPGVHQLYAERLVQRQQPGWPAQGTVAPFVEFTLAMRGKIPARGNA